MFMSNVYKKSGYLTSFKKFNGDYSKKHGS